MALKALHLHFILRLNMGASIYPAPARLWHNKCAQPILPQSTTAAQGWSPTRFSIETFTKTHQHLDGKLQMLTLLDLLVLG